MMFRFSLSSSQLLGMAALSLLLTTACNSSGGGGGEPAGLNPPLVKMVPKDKYMNGKKFCETYSEITKKEFGRYVQVPANYNRPEDGTIEIYVYTMSPFDAKKPSYIYVDGGPGQNSHDLMPDYLAGAYNELRFDQRGLGCSAPETWEQYMNQALYSSQNNVRDMEEIRKSFGIKQWSIYGLSYGTVPATMYASQFPAVTTSLVLEGVFGRPDQVHLLDYKTNKMNLALADLNTAQREGFTNLVYEDSEDSDTLFTLLFKLFYRDIGMRQAKSYLQRFISHDGQINRNEIAELRENFRKNEERYPLPQQPGAVDEYIFDVINCKNLGARDREYKSLAYSHSRGFYTTPSTSTENLDICDAVGVFRSLEQPYKIENTKVSVPVYYFQGSHDGATMAIGAITHWKTIPTGLSYFMLAQKGGHNPNLARLDSETKAVAEAQQNLLKLSLDGAVLTASDLLPVNAAVDPIQKWILYTDYSSAFRIEDELQGIQNLKIAR